MSFFSPSIGYTGVRPELDCIVEYIPGESLEAFSKRTRIPLHQLAQRWRFHHPHSNGGLSLNPRRWRFLHQHHRRFFQRNHRGQRKQQYQPGDELLAVPTHICPTCAMHKQAYVVENGAVTGTWNIVGRDRVLSI